MHLGGFEISFIYSCTCRSVIVTMKKRKKKEKEKKEKGEKKKRKRSKESGRGRLGRRRTVLLSSLLARCCACDSSPPSSSRPVFFLFSPPLLSLSPLLPLNLYHLLLSRFLILIFPKRFRALRRGWLPIRLLPLPLLLLFDLLSHPRSPFILDHWISLQHPAQTERTNGFLSLFPRFSGAEENVTDFESRVLQLSASKRFLLPARTYIYVYIFRSAISCARSAPHIIIIITLLSSCFVRRLELELIETVRVNF